MYLQALFLILSSSSNRAGCLNQSGTSNSIYLGATRDIVLVGLGRIRFSARMALIKTFPCSQITSFLLQDVGHNYHPKGRSLSTGCEFESPVLDANQL